MAAPIPAPIELLALGEGMLEFNQTGEGGGRLYLQGFGGDTSNFAISAARQGACAGYISALGAKTVALKLGSQGALVANANERHRIDAHACEPVDATGAGDAFGGAFVARLIAGDDLRSAGRYAAVAAALSTEGFGAVDPIPHAERVRIAPHVRMVHALARPQFAQHAAVAVVAERRDVAGARTLPCGGDREVRRVAAEALQV